MPPDRAGVIGAQTRRVYPVRLVLFWPRRSAAVPKFLQNLSLARLVPTIDEADFTVVLYPRAGLRASFESNPRRKRKPNFGIMRAGEPCFRAPRNSTQNLGGRTQCVVFQERGAT